MRDGCTLVYIWKEGIIKKYSDKTFKQLLTNVANSTVET